MSSVPEDVYLAILLRVPAVKSIYACTCVCKSWFKIISNPSFAKMHLNITKRRKNFNLIFERCDERCVGERRRNSNWTINSISYDSSSSVDGSEIVKMVDFPFNSLPVGPFRFIGSCSGVVCLWFANGVETFICFCNPATKECRRILKRQDNFWNDYDINIINAFGYDCKYDDYKLINIVKRPETDRLLDVIVYKLGSNAWECNQTVTYKFPDKRQTGILVNGAFHWFGEAPEKNPSKLIISMNISNEKFDEVQFPKELYDKNHFPMTIGVLEGCLCLVVTVSMSGSEVWMMQEYGVRESWTQVYTIDNESIWSFPDTDYTLRLVHSFGNGQILLKYGYRLVTYDPEHKRGRELQKNSSSMIHDSMNYVESLVSLSFGYLCR